MKQKMIYIKIEEKKEKKKYVAQKQYNWVRKKELFLYFVKGSDHSNIIFSEGLLCLLCIIIKLLFQSRQMT